MTTVALKDAEGPTRFAPVVSVTSVYSIVHVLPVSSSVFRPVLPTEVDTAVIRRGSEVELSLAVCPVCVLSVVKFSEFSTI